MANDKKIVRLLIEAAFASERATVARKRGIVRDVRGYRAAARLLLDRARGMDPTEQSYAWDMFKIPRIVNGGK